METEVLERRFAEIGARVKVEEPLRGSPRIDVRTDRRGEYFAIRFGRVGPDAELAVVEARPEDPFRSGGTTVYVNRRHPTGIGEDRFRRLSDEERRTGNWSRMVRDADVFAKGSIRHRDPATVVLPGWHRVVMNTEQRARAMRHVVVLD